MDSVLMVSGMERNYREKPFEVVTIAGYCYSITLNEFSGWFTNRWFWVFIFGVSLICIVLMPHNAIYDLDWRQRLVFWPINILLYLGVYSICIYFGARYALRRPDRQYYTPIGLVLATLICTLGGSFYVGYVHNEPADLSVFKWMEVIFNLLWACVFEAFHYAVIAPRLRKLNAARKHRWEEF